MEKQSEIMQQQSIILQKIDKLEKGMKKQSDHQTHIKQMKDGVFRKRADVKVSYFQPEGTSRKR